MLLLFCYKNFLFLFNLLSFPFLSRGVSPEPGAVHGVPDVHSESGPAKYGPGPGLPGADDPAAGAGARRHRTGPAHRQRDGQGQGEDPQAL